jgi:hypothetical protein
MTAISLACVWTLGRVSHPRVHVLALALCGIASTNRIWLALAENNATYSSAIRPAAESLQPLEIGNR